ncbi:proteasome regulatory particle subunit [Microbotryomycetes sp. JL221]|nr:proteasome regulatory particle subunit [Microbotryomycetes sp. JL221]
MQKTSVSQAADDVVPCVPNLKLAQLAFNLGQSSFSDKNQAEQQLRQGIEDDGKFELSCDMANTAHWIANMAPFCDMLMQTRILNHDQQLLDRLRQKNSAELAKLQETLDDARANLGETEVSDALRARAMFLARIGDKDAAIAAHEEAIEKTPGLGTKIDLRLTMIRIGFFYGDHQIISTNVDKTQGRAKTTFVRSFAALADCPSDLLHSHRLVDEGGDWDRRNRLKAYEGLYLLSIRNFKRGGELLLDVLSTFTATELLDYDEFVTLCVIAGALILDRKDLKKKIIDAPEVIALIPTTPSLSDYCASLWKCDYNAFFRALAKVEETHFLKSRLLSPHTRYYVREMRIKAYAQLLESYRSVTLTSLCDAFGVSQSFMDA